jgi:hypothetical protein
MSLQVAYGQPPGPTPPADYAPSLRSPWRAASVLTAHAILSRPVHDIVEFSYRTAPLPG